MKSHENPQSEPKHYAENNKTVSSSDNLVLFFFHLNPKRQRFVPLFLFFLLALSLPLNSMASTQSPPPRRCRGSDSGPVVPTAPLVTFLERVKDTALRSYPNSSIDPKFYVDLSLKHRHDLSTAESAFDRLTESHTGSVPVNELEGFIREYFDGAGEDLVGHEPEDYVSEPQGFLAEVENGEVRAWAIEVHGLWKNLSRRVSDSVRDSPDRHTLLPLPEPVIIPGFRFREIYYWDSYWIIRGLLASKMYATAKAIANNLISLLDTYGYVLNGARAYYTNRSQPPFLSSMVYEIYNRTGDKEFLRRSLPMLVKEYEFWNSGMHKVIIRDAYGVNHTLNRYYAMWDKPRPEAFAFDREIASGFSSASEKRQFYRDLATAAESGWDFSTRWMRDSSDFTTLATTSVVPVDLNVFILKMELDIAFLMEASGEKNGAKSFLEASKARERAIHSVFWNEKAGQWQDYWLTCNNREPETWEARNQNPNVFASNFIPIWINSFNSDANLVKKVVETLKSSGLIRSAGIATSLTNSGQQWDFPNGWAPLQHMIVEGLGRSGVAEARAMAEDIAIRWIRSNYAVYKKTGAMHEKLNVERFGQYGGGGEYKPQTGFGWSNGVILAFLEEFGWPLDLNIDS